MATRRPSPLVVVALALCLFSGLSGSTAAAPAAEAELLPAPGGVVTRRVLPGGPTVLLQPIPGRGAVGVALAVPAGSRYDPGGQSGRAHLLARLVSRATPGFPGGHLPLALEKVGARWGARVTVDHLLFWEVVPSDELDLALRLEADRLSGLRLTPRDLERERQSLARDLEATARDPLLRLESRLRRSLWPHHPAAARPPAGRARDVRSLRVEQLQEHYQQGFHRGKAVLAVAGDFSLEPIQERLAELFPPAPAKEGGEEPAVVLPTVEEGSETGDPLLLLLFPAPRYGEPLAAAAALLDAALAQGPTSLLARALPGVRIRSRLDLYEGWYRLEVRPASEPIRERVFQVLEDLGRRPLAPSEVEAASSRARARFFQDIEGPGERALFLARQQAAGSLEVLAGFPEALASLSPLDLQRAARSLLSRDRAVAGRLGWGSGGEGEGAREPAGSTPREDRTDEPAPGAQANRVGRPLPPPPRPGREERSRTSGVPFTRRELENGLTVLVAPMADLPTVTLRGYLEGGSLLDPPGYEGLTWVTASLLGRGTASRPGWTFAGELADSGMELRFEARREVVYLEGWTLADRLPRFLELLADALRRPLPSLEEVERARRSALEELERLESQAEGRALLTLLRAMYPPGHPCSRLPLGTAEGIRALSPPLILRHLKEIRRPDRLVLAFTGDVEAGQILEGLEPELTAWWEKIAPPPPGAAVVPLPEPRTLRLSSEGQEALILLGHPAPGRRDPDYYAFNLLNQILGGQPATSRLARRIRDLEGLGTVSSRLVPAAGPAPWAVTLRVRPEVVDQAVAAAREEMERLRQAPPAIQEVERARRYLEGRLAVALADPAGRAEMLASLELRRLSDTYPRDFAGIYRGITPRDLLEVARRRLRPDHLVVVVASPDSSERNARATELMQ